MRVSVQAAAERVNLALTRSFGPAGARALFSRGLSQVRPDHPVLADFRLGDKPNQVFADLSSRTATHGDAAIAAALEAVLVATLGVLSRLVGEDMVTRLLEESLTNPAPQDETPS